MGGKAFIYKIVVIATAIAIILLTIPYWIHLNYSVHHSDVVWIVLDVLSAVFMIILGVIGIIGALKSGRMLLLIYAIGMLCMFIFILIQMIINLIDYRTCDNETNLVIFTCNYNEAGYLVPTVLMLIITLVGGIAAILLRKQIVADDKPSGSYY